MPDYSCQSKTLILGGYYEHYSGKLYKVIEVARHTETLEEVVVYQALYDKMDFWVRPLKMFLEEIEIKSILVPRFKYIKNC